MRGSSKPSAGTFETAVITRRADQIEARAISWLWPHRFALGKLSIIAGDPGGGKSQLTLDMAARITRGTSWPDGTAAPQGSVVIISAEDDPEDTIVPRLIAAVADLSRIHIFDAVRESNDAGTSADRSLSLARDLELLEAKLPVDCTMVVIDPISAYLGGADGNSNAELRELLAPLAKLAQRRGLAVVAVTHLNKMDRVRSAYRVTGSIAFTAAARAVYVVAKDQDDPKRRLLLPLKNNLGDDESGLAYRIGQTTENVPYLVWEPDPVTVPTDDALSYDDGERNGREVAQEFLLTLLANGPIEAKAAESEARAAGISPKCLRSARERLGIQPKKTEFLGPWTWALPTKAPVGAPCSEVGNFEKPGIFDAVIDSPKMPANAEGAQKSVPAPVGHLRNGSCPDCGGKGCDACRVQIIL